MPKEVKFNYLNYSLQAKKVVVKNQYIYTSFSIVKQFPHFI